MAKASFKDVEIRPAVPAVKERRVTLEMSEAEAAGLRAILRRTSYQPAHPNSVYNVYAALGGVVVSKLPAVKIEQDSFGGRIKFEHGL